jgi:Uma2 family endonuclease
MSIHLPPEASMILKAYPPEMTAEEFEIWNDADGHELIDGQPREKAMGVESSKIQTKLLVRLDKVVTETGLGELFDAECMYRCFPSRPRQVRKPDTSLVLQERLPKDGLPRGMFRIRPDFVVEVVSPNEAYEEVDEKVRDYFDAGVPLIWVITPKTRSVLVYHADGTARRFGPEDELTGDPIIPGFRVRVADLFPPPALPTPETPPA